MTRMSRVAAGAACALVLGLAAATAGQAPQAPAGPAGPKLTPEEILAFHAKDETGGSPEAGRPIYEKLCAACHIFGGIGREVGPDLTTIASRFKKTDLLDSILWPSKVVSDQYQSEMVELTSGSVVTGVIVRESATVLVLRTGESPEKPVSIPKGQIAQRARSAASLMPEGLLEGLTQEEIAGLLAFMLAPAPAK